MVPFLKPHHLCCVKLGDSDVLKEKIAHCHLRVLQLIGDSNQLLPILSGVKDNCSITDLVIEGGPIIACLYHVGVYICTCVWLRPLVIYN